MITKKTHNFKLKKYKISIKCILEKHVNKKYISSLKKADYILNKNNNILNQVEYIKKIRLSKSRMILGFFYNKKLIASSGLQNLHKKLISVGIFIFDKKFLNRKISHYFIANSCIFANKFLNKITFCAGFNSKNLKSISSYEKIGFKTYLKKGKNIFKKTSLKKINSILFNR